MRRRGDVDLRVFGSRNVGDRAVREYEEWRMPVFDVQVWNPATSYELRRRDACSPHDLDVLHIQYSNLFYNRRRLDRPDARASTAWSRSPTTTRSCRARVPAPLPDLLYAHREDVGIGARRLIPQGIDVRPPVVKTFGLGKSRDDVIGEVCERNGWRLETSFGEQRWLESEELYRWLRDCDAIVLWYDEDLTSGGSAAAPLAIATRRPVFVNDTEWFRDLPERTATLRKVADLEELEREMRALLGGRLRGPSAAGTWSRRRSSRTIARRSRAREEGAGRRMPLRARGFAAMDDKPLIKIKRRLDRPQGGALVNGPVGFAVLREPAADRRRPPRAAGARAGPARPSRASPAARRFVRRLRRASAANLRPDSVKSWDVLRSLEAITRRTGPDDPVLDMGSVGCAILPALHRLGYRRLAGIDLNPQVRHMPHAGEIDYRVGDMTATEWPDGTSPRSRRSA